MPDTHENLLQFQSPIGKPNYIKKIEGYWDLAETFFLKNVIFLVEEEYANIKTIA